jgi:ADP-heptose:LPS heptosyltransferase
VTGGRKIAFWLINAGIKNDFTTKAWPVEYFQEVVNRTCGRIQWVQIGAKEHDHPVLTGVIDLRGQTDHRQLIRLVWHAQGGLGPVTYLQHLCAAWEKPYVCLLGGREPVTWTQ